MSQLSTTLHQLPMHDTPYTWHLLSQSRALGVRTQILLILQWHWEHNLCFDLSYSLSSIKLNKLALVEKALDRMKGKLVDEAFDAAKFKVTKIATKAGLKSWLGPIGWAWTAYDVYDGITSIKKLKEYIGKIKKQVTELKKFTKDFADMNGDNPEEDMAKIMKYIVKFNECIRARKCQLVPYTEAKGPKSTQKGCCNGQTGHHIIPNSFYYIGSATVEDASGKTIQGKKVSDCPKYHPDKAPVEGVGKTHGDMHQVFQVRTHATKDYFGGDIEYKYAQKAAIRSHRATFPLSHCSTKCLAAQLRNHKEKACKKGGKVVNNPELMYKPIVPVGEGDE